MNVAAKLPADSKLGIIIAASSRGKEASCTTSQRGPDFLYVY